MTGSFLLWLTHSWLGGWLCASVAASVIDRVWFRRRRGRTSTKAARPAGQRRQDEPPPVARYIAWVLAAVNAVCAVMATGFAVQGPRGLPAILSLVVAAGNVFAVAWLVTKFRRPDPYLELHRLMYRAYTPSPRERAALRDYAPAGYLVEASWPAQQ